MRIIFAGSDEFSLPALSALILQRCIVAVLTRVPKGAGRGRKITVTKVEQLARDHHLEVLHPEKLDAEARAKVATLKPDLLVAASYGKIFGPKFLALFPRGAINIHPSLLPRHRGPSPLQATILAGDLYGGVSIQYLVREMDAGDILAQKKVKLSGKEHRVELEQLLAKEGAQLLIELLPQIVARKEQRHPQNHDEASYCPLLHSDMGEIDWHKPADLIERMFRAYHPWPGIYTYYKKKRLKLVEVALGEELSPIKDEPGRVQKLDKINGILIQTGKENLIVRKLQREGKKALSWKDFLNGEKDFLGAQLGS